jgi:hypothetical protein
MGGSYVANSLEPLDGELTIPLADGSIVNLHMSKVHSGFYNFCSVLFCMCSNFMIDRCV